MSTNKPNIAQLRKYLNGELDTRAMFELERQAESDPLLMDLLRGMESDSMENHEANLADIDKLIKARVEKDKRHVITPVTWWLVAASLLIALGIGSWFLSRQTMKETVDLNLKAEFADKTTIAQVPVSKPVIAAKQNVTTPAHERTYKQSTVKATGDQVLAALNSPKTDSSSNITSALKTGIDTNLAYRKTARANTESITLKELSIKPGYRFQDKSTQLSDTLLRKLEGKATGVQINSGDILIRGNVTISKGSEPVYIVNGIPLADSKLSSINPADIESISVLKDSSARSLYGSRADNGAVLINTKKGLSEVAVMSRMKSAASAAMPAATKSSTQIITGRVVDQDGKEPLPGVSVKVDGTQTATTTDVNGRFVINLPTGKDILDIAYIGYSAQHLKVKKRDSLNITLLPNSNSLNEVVIAGYGTQKADDVTVEDAQPANGWKAYNKYLHDNTVMPDGATGKIKLTFIIDKNGNIIDIHIIKGLSETMNRKAIELIQNGPKWKAESDGKPQRISLTIKFRKP